MTKRKFAWCIMAPSNQAIARIKVLSVQSPDENPPITYIKQRGLQEENSLRGKRLLLRDNRNGIHNARTTSSKTSHRGGDVINRNAIAQSSIF